MKTQQQSTSEMDGQSEMKIVDQHTEMMMRALDELSTQLAIAHAEKQEVLTSKQTHVIHPHPSMTSNSSFGSSRQGPTRIRASSWRKLLLCVPLHR